MITVSGNLGSDPEIRFTANGLAMAKFRLAITKRVKQADGTWSDGETTWLDVVSWRTLAENVCESLVKGSRVIVTGELKSRTYEKKDGTTGTSIEIDATDIGPSLSNQSARLAKATKSNRVERGMTTLSDALGDAWSEVPQAEAAPF